MLEFLKTVSLSDPEKKRVFLFLISNQKLMEMATSDYREIYMQKVEELAYDPV